MGKRKFTVKIASVATRVTEQVLSEIKRIVLAEGYNDLGDYLRSLIRKDFRERGIKLKIEEKLEGEEASS